MKQFFAVLLIVLIAGVLLFYRTRISKTLLPPVTSTAMHITSSAFEHNGRIPSKYTCDGNDTNPPLTISEIPENTQSLALIVDDPDAPVGTWDHWVMWNIDPQTTDIGENSVPEGATEGKNSWGQGPYGGPCPPSGTHRYFFKLYALDTKLEANPDTDKKELLRAIEGHVLAEAELIGLYSRE